MSAAALAAGSAVADLEPELYDQLERTRALPSSVFRATPVHGESSLEAYEAARAWVESPR